MNITINFVFKTNSGLPILYLYIWHLQEKLKFKVFWANILFSTRANEICYSCKFDFPMCIYFGGFNVTNLRQSQS